MRDLYQGERIIAKAHPSRAKYIPYYILTVLLLASAILIYLFSEKELLALSLALASIIPVIYAEASRTRTTYVLTNFRVRLIRGSIRKTIDDVILSQVTGVKVVKGLAGSIFNYGDVLIDTGGRNVYEIVLKCVGNPEWWQTQITGLIYRMQPPPPPT